MEAVDWGFGKDQPPKLAGDYVLYTHVLEGHLEPNTVCLLPFRRSAVPTAMIAGQIKRSDVVNIEKAKLGRFLADGVFVQTRTTYRGCYKDYYLPSINHPYIKKVIDFVSKNFGSVYIITLEMYEMTEQWFEKRGYKKMYVLVDTESARKMLEKVIDLHRANILAKAGALLPWLADELANNGLEGVREQLTNLMVMGPRDRCGLRDVEEVYDAISNAFKLEPKYLNRNLAISLDLLCSLNPFCRVNRHKNCSGRFPVKDKKGDTVAFCTCPCHILSKMSMGKLTDLPNDGL